MLIILQMELIQHLMMPEKTMTSYNLTLRFNELEPIFDKDYDIEGAENFMLLPTLEEEAGHTIGF